MKMEIKIIAIAALLIVIVSSVLYWQETKTGLSNNQTTPSPTPIITPTPVPTPKVKITNFVCTGVWHGTRLGGAYDLFSLSYTNLGNTTAEYLIISLNTTKASGKDPNPNATYNPNEGYLDEYLNGETYALDNLNAGQTKTLDKTYFMWGAYEYVEPFYLTATLKSNSTILDQATILIPINNIV